MIIVTCTIHHHPLLSTSLAHLPSVGSLLINTSIHQHHHQQHPSNITVDFDGGGGGGVGLAVAVIGINGNYGYSSSEISKIEC
mmetsp:Transcript_16643/g.24770  ORF Transcript_16643/g.24770 Transcript_16643/m.24770 type:complete len:83 (-) Transcript_16643:34-282(-)